MQDIKQRRHEILSAQAEIGRILADRGALEVRVGNKYRTADGQTVDCFGRIGDDPEKPGYTWAGSIYDAGLSSLYAWNKDGVSYTTEPGLVLVEKV